MVHITNDTKDTTVAGNARKADNLLARGRGLMLAPPLPDGGGLVLDPCGSIHMFFMRYPLDILFLDREGNVVSIETSEICTPGRLDAAVERRRKPEVPGVCQYLDASIAEGGKNLGRRVGGSVVHDDELEVAEGLAKNALDRVAHKGLGVVDGHDDAHTRGRRHPLTSWTTTAPQGRTAIAHRSLRRRAGTSTATCDRAAPAPCPQI